MSGIFRWFTGSRKISGIDWNEIADILEDMIFGPETVDELPPPTSENMGRVVRLSTDGRIYICVPDE